MSTDLSLIRNETLALVKLGMPLIIAQILMVSMGFIDTVMVGRLGATHLAAIAMGSSLWILIFLTASGLLMSVSPIIAQLYGAKKKTEIGRQFQQGIWLALFVGVAAAFALQHIDKLVELMQVDAAVIPITRGYLYATSWSMPAVCFFQIGRYLNEAIGNSGPIMIFQAVFIVTGVLGNYTFIYGNFGVPAMGAVGAGVATSIAFWINAVMMAVYVARHSRFSSFKLFAHFRAPEISGLRSLLKLGIPISATMIMETGLFTAVALLMGTIGATELAAHQVAINYAALMFMMPLGLSMAISVRVGQAAGAGAPDLVRLRGLIGIFLGGILMVISATVMLLIPEKIIGIYTDDVQVTGIAMSLLSAAAIFQLSDGLQVCGLGALRGLKDVNIPLMINLLSYWLLGLPVAWYLGIAQGLWPAGLWYGLVLGLSVAAVLLNSRFIQLSTRLVHLAAPKNQRNRSRRL